MDVNASFHFSKLPAATFVPSLHPSCWPAIEGGSVQVDWPEGDEGVVQQKRQ